MMFTGTAKKAFAFILSLAIVLSGLYVFAPHKADAAETPVVRVLGASIRLSGTDNAGKQSMRIGIVVDNASKAVSCRINVTVDSHTFVISTAKLADGELGIQKKTLYAKDIAADRVVYVATITNMSQDTFYNPVEISGSAKGIDGTVYSSKKITRNIMGIVNSMQNSYPTLGITMENGTLYKNNGQTQLTAADIAGGNYAYDPMAEAGDIYVPTAPPVVTPTPTVVTPTPTVRPTATPDPNATAVPNADVAAVYTASSITVDGNVDSAWNSISAYPIQNYGTGWVGTSSAGTAKMLWNNSNLYVLIDVIDPSIDYSNSNPWEQDGVEIFFDENNSKESSYDNNNDAFQYRFTGLSGNSGTADTNDFANGVGSDARTWYASRQFAYVRTSNGYRIECSIPFHTAPVANQVVGFDITLMDCYNGTRNNEIWLTGIGKGNMYQDPSLIGNMKLSMTAVPVPTARPTPTPSPTPTPAPTADPSDPYTVELFTVTATENKVETVNGNTVTVDMKFFGGSASGTYFNGNILNSEKSCDVVKTYKSSGNEVHQARYFLDGKDRNGNNCRIFIEDNSISAGNGTVITKPIFITNSSALAFLEKADVQGRVTTDSQGRKIIKYMWNSSNTTPVPFREVHMPDSTHNYTKEVFTINIDVGGSDSVNGANGSATMIYFGGSSNCNNLKNATIVASDADTRLQYTGTIQTLSARYILSGKRADGVTPMKVYVENNGIDNNGMVTEPTIITDDPSLAYVESAWTHGTVGWEPGLTIHLWTTP